MILLYFGSLQRGNTALHLACQRHHSGIALMLLRAGCEMDTIDKVLSLWFICQCPSVCVCPYVSFCVVYAYVELFFTFFYRTWLCLTSVFAAPLFKICGCVPWLLSVHFYPDSVRTCGYLGDGKGGWTCRVLHLSANWVVFISSLLTKLGCVYFFPPHRSPSLSAEWTILNRCSSFEAVWQHVFHLQECLTSVILIVEELVHFHCRRQGRVPSMQLPEKVWWMLCRLCVVWDVKLTSLVQWVSLSLSLCGSNLVV